MMFKKKWQPAREEWGLTLVWNETNPRRAGTREEHFIPEVFPSREAAQARCDELNPKPYGMLVPERYEREAGWVLEGTLPLGGGRTEGGNDG